MVVGSAVGALTRSQRDLTASGKENALREPRLSGGGGSLFGSSGIGYGLTRSARAAHVGAENVVPVATCPSLGGSRLSCGSSGLPSSSVGLKPGGLRSNVAAPAGGRLSPRQQRVALGDLSNLGAPSVALGLAKPLVKPLVAGLAGSRHLPPPTQPAPLAQPALSQRLPPPMRQPQPAVQALAAPLPRSSPPRRLPIPRVQERHSLGEGDAAPALPAAAVADVQLRGDAGDIRQVADYADEVHAQLLSEEHRCMVRVDYMRQQTDITPHMRGILLDWLVEVHFLHFKLRLETLYLTQYLVDQYLAVRPVRREKLQLIGVTCMLIAAKFEEIDVPKVSQFAHITDNTYTKLDIMQTECRVLAAVGYQTVVATPAHFMHRLFRANASDETQQSLAQYLVELSLLDVQFLRYAASHLVCAAILLSNELTGRRELWSATLQRQGLLSEANLRACADELRQALQAAPRSALQSVRKKYSMDTHHQVAERFARF